MFAVTYNGIYMAKDHRKIIVFDTSNEAVYFVNQFFKYAKERAAAEMQQNMSNPFLLHEILMAQNSMSIEEVNYPLSNCETINFKDLER